MTSFVIASKDKNKRLSYTRDYCAKLNIDPFDITFIEKDPESKNSQSIGIEDIKTIHKKIFLKPFRSATKAIIIDDAHILTPEAQNALLKILEEPPKHTIILLAAESKDAFLPTILSRCQIVEIEEDRTELSDEYLREYKTFIESLTNVSIGDRLN